MFYLLAPKSDNIYNIYNIYNRHLAKETMSQENQYAQFQRRSAIVSIPKNISKPARGLQNVKKFQMQKHQKQQQQHKNKRPSKAQKTKKIKFS